MIGVGISTRNREMVLARSLEAWRAHLPQRARLVVVDDASDVPVESDFRFAQRAGVARVKNRCLALLDGCEHVFLADDDCWPVRDGWWEPYISSPVPHLAYLWGGRVLASRDGWVARSVFHGCLLYARRNVIDAVGGMRPEFGPFGYEHVEWSRRIHAAGLTPHKYIDVEGSDDLWHSMDRVSRAGGEYHASSMGPDRKAIARRNIPLLESLAGATGYVDYREHP